MKNVGNNSRGRSQGVPKIFSAPMYRAHCAVIFAIAQLFCQNYFTVRISGKFIIILSLKITPHVQRVCCLHYLMKCQYITRKLCYRKDDRTMHRHVHWKFSGHPGYAHGYYCQNFSWSFVLIDPVNVATKFEVRSFTRSWDNRGTQKIWQSLDTPTLTFLPNF